MPAYTPIEAVPEELMPTNLMMLLPSIARNQEAIFKKVQRMEHKCIQVWHYMNSRDATIREALASITSDAMPTFPTFPASLFAGDCPQLASPKTNSSTPSNATEPFTPAVEESAKTESDEVQRKPSTSSILATPVDSANT
ncbi:hypothetical protein V6N11_037754 [Hibiscus sabdariffa]|uniref:Uncharacterized protein n=2 Tax=Hibiscus sabdariffa TaxID=183260 RepID=A0ABR2PEF4_9ROSI